MKKRTFWTAVPLTGAALFLFVLAAGGNRAPAQEVPYDVLLRGGTVLDGSGEPGFRADVAVREDRIARVDREGIDPGDAREVLDAEGLVVTPGFIDHHAHVQTSITRHPLAENFLRQGITTIVASLHSGTQPWPLDEHMASLEVAPNVGFFAGHTWTRERVMGTENRAPTAEELDRMREYVETTMCHGALGLSTGLLYVPGAYAETEEVIELAKVAGRYGGIYVSHMRDEALELVESVRELIRIADEGGLPGQVNHHKARAVEAWGSSRESLALIDSARAEGLDITHDVYPYAASSTSSRVLFPAWVFAGGADSLRARLDDPETRAGIEDEMRDIIGKVWSGEDLSRIQFRSVSADPSYDGRTMADMARDRGLPVNVETGVQLAIELQLEGGFSAIYHAMSEEDVERILAHPWAMINTDGDAVGYGVGFPHPRSYGTFPRVLARYVRERGVLSMEEAIRRMTSLSAEQIGQPERGLVREGLFADLVAFDPDGIEDLATYTDPHRFSVGIRHVLVNGTPVIRDASLTGAKPGRVIRGPARPDRVEADVSGCDLEM